MPCVSLTFYEVFAKGTWRLALGKTPWNGVGPTPRDCSGPAARPGDVSLPKSAAVPGWERRLQQGMDVRIFGCSDIRMFGCSNALMFGCSDALMFGCSDVPMFGCSDVRGFPPTAAGLGRCSAGKTRLRNCPANPNCPVPFGAWVGQFGTLPTPLSRLFPRSPFNPRCSGCAVRHLSTPAASILSS